MQVVVDGMLRSRRSLQLFMSGLPSGGLPRGIFLGLATSGSAAAVVGGGGWLHLQPSALHSSSMRLNSPRKLDPSQLLANHCQGLHQIRTVELVCDSAQSAKAQADFAIQPIL